MSKGLTDEEMRQHARTALRKEVEKHMMTVLRSFKGEDLKIEIDTNVINIFINGKERFYVGIEHKAIRGAMWSRAPERLEADPCFNLESISICAIPSKLHFRSQTFKKRKKGGYNFDLFRNNLRKYLEGFLEHEAADLNFRDRCQEISGKRRIEKNSYSGGYRCGAVVLRQDGGSVSVQLNESMTDDKARKVVRSINTILGR